jgi:integrase
MLSSTTQKEDDLVFCHPDGSPFLPDTSSHSWSKLAMSVGLMNCHLHIAWHSMASKMLQDGIHPAIVQQRLGHASIQTTIDAYSHILPGLAEAAAAKLDSWLIPKQQNEPVKVDTEND